MPIRENESAFIKHRNNAYFTQIIDLMPDYVLESSSINTIHKNETIVSAGYPVKDVFYILNGELAVVNEFESGKIYVPVLISSDDFIGVVEAVIDDSEFISTVAALNDVDYIKIPKEIFKRWIHENPVIATTVLKAVSTNFRKNMRDAGEQILLDSMYLLLTHILKSSFYSEKQSLHILDESRENTAQRTGINIRTLYRYINKLKEEDFITLHKKRLAYTDEQKTRLMNYSIELRNK